MEKSDPVKNQKNKQRKGTNTKHSREESPTKNKRIEIEINRFNQLVDAFNNPRTLVKVIAVVSIIVVLIFFGVSLISLMLKRFFPYKSISTIQSGATIIKNDDTEVIYWLFNSADLWANSGIEVEEGEVITVRASGAFHTAIHHAVEDAQNNGRFRDRWIRPTGGRAIWSSRESARREYRIMPHADDNILLMQIIPDEFRNTGQDWLKNVKTASKGYLDGRAILHGKDGQKQPYVNIVIIGEEKRDIRVPCDGILHFAVNDIVLTERILDSMQKNIKIVGIKKDSIQKEIIYRDTGCLRLGTFPLPRSKKELDGVVSYMKNPCNRRFISKQCLDSTKLDSMVGIIENIDSETNSKTQKDSLTRIIIDQNLTELDYYRMHDFADAWFVDNVGSILIAIERKKK